MNDFRKCSIDGCENKYYAKSFCQRHYKSLIRTGDPLKAKHLKSVVLDWKEACRFQTKTGHIRLIKVIRGVTYRKFEHVLFWEAENGLVPQGFVIHHIDGVPSNNSLDNLMCIERGIHTKIHAGLKLIDGEWWKCCCGCNILKMVNNIYFDRKKDGYNSICKDCQKIKNRENRISNIEEYRERDKRYYAKIKAKKEQRND